MGGTMVNNPPPCRRYGIYFNTKKLYKETIWSKTSWKAGNGQLGKFYFPVGKIFFLSWKIIFFQLENSYFPTGIFSFLIMRELQKLARKVKFIYSFILPCCSGTRTTNFCKWKNCILARTYKSYNVIWLSG